MKTVKLTVILLALLLAAMAMVPMVSASTANEANAVAVDEMNALTVDMSKTQLPQLQFDKSQKNVVVSGELSPKENTRAAQIATIVTIYQNPTVSSIPYGSIIYHSKNGVTTVFDSTGRQLFAADDAKAAKVTTPQTEAPATFVHEIPSGSISREYQGKTFVFYQGNLILTIINENVQESNKRPCNNDALTQNDAQEPQKMSGIAYAGLSNYRDWIEYAESTSVTVDRFEATWTAPTRTPLNSGVRESLAIWNGIERSGIDGVMQPVLMWNFCPYQDNQIHNYYVGSAWDYRTTSNPNKDSLHSTPISVSPGDTIRGTLQWSQTYGCWLIQFKNVRSGQTTGFYTTRFSRDNLRLYMTLEATAAGVKRSTDSLTGSITFNNIIVQNLGSNVPVTFTGRIYPGASSVFPGLNPRVTTYPQLQVNLDTGR